MSGWVSRLLGLSDKKSEKSQAAKKAAARASAPQREAPTAWHPPADTDTVFLRWLLGRAAGAAENISTAEKHVLESLERLLQSELSGADLIPRVPSVIPQLLQSLHNENISGAELSQAITRDVALVAEVLRQANSSFYKPREPITSIENAVMVLGKNGLRMLIAKASFRPLINVQSGRYAKVAAPQLWQQSELCAQACRILAQQERIDPFAAFLAGLMQNVGMIVAFRVADQTPSAEQLQASEAFCRDFNAHTRALSHRIAAQWNLPEAVVEALAELREAAPPASSTGNVVFTADHLSKLLMLMDQNMLSEDRETLAATMPESIVRCFEQIKAGAHPSA